MVDTSPADKSISKEELERRFESLWKAHKLFPAVVLARFALRQFPMLGKKGHFNFWNDNKERLLKHRLATFNNKIGIDFEKDIRAVNLLSVFHSSRIVINIADNINSHELNKNLLIQFSQASTLVSIYTADVTSESLPSYSSSPASASASASASAAQLNNAANSCSIAASVVIAAYSRPENNVQEIISDIELIESGVDLSSFIKTPLWKHEIPEITYQNYNNNFLHATESLIQETPDPNTQQALEKMLTDYSQLAGFNHTQAIKQSIATNDIAPEADSQTTDKLNRGHLVSGLSDLLSDPNNNGHLTIGLLGHWGAGKTRVLDLLKTSLKQKNPTAETPFLFGEFNAWAYEYSKNIQAGMAHEVISSLTQFQDATDNGEEKTGILQKISAIGRKIWWALFVKVRLTVLFIWSKYPSLLMMFLLCLLMVAWVWWYTTANLASHELQDLVKDYKILLPSLGSIILLVPILKEIRTLVSQSFTQEFLTYVKLPSYAEHIGQVSEMREDIRLMSNIRLGDGKRRLLFIVDDLDRCNPEGIVKTFEAIRLILDIPHVTVVIAIDQRIALAALALHYEDLEKHHQLNNARIIARDYLGKMIQLPVVLQEPDVNTVSQLMAYIWQDEEENNNWKSHIFPQKAVNNNKIDEDIVSEESDLSEHKGLSLEQLIDNINQLTPINNKLSNDTIMGLSNDQKAAFIYWSNYFKLNNPRQLKRLHNSYNLLRKVAPQADQQQSNTCHLGFGVLMSLIVLEFINCEEDVEKRQDYRDYIFERKSGIVVTAKDKERLDYALTAITDIAVHHPLTQNNDNHSLAATQSLLHFVELFVLPAIECNSSKPYMETT